MNKIIIWVKPDGSIKVQRFIQEEFAKAKVKFGVSEAQYIQAQINSIKSERIDFANVPHFIKDKSELKSIINSNPNGHIDKVKCDNQGNLSLDLSVITAEEALQIKKENLISKLAVLGLTNDE